jgi:hypothetical protein
MGGATGDPNSWSNPANWSGGVPGPADTAVFNSSATADVNVDVAEAPAAVSFGGDWAHKLTLSVNLSTSGASTWNAGTFIGGAGVWNNLGTITINATNGITLNGATLNNTGTINDVNGTLNLIGGAAINNAATGIYNFQNDSNISWNNVGSVPSVTNAGLIKKSGGNGISEVDGAVSVPGSVWESDSGSLHLSPYGQTYNGGTFNANSPGSIDMTYQGTNIVAAVLKGTFTGNGTGEVYLDRSCTIDAAGATFNFPSTTPFVWFNSTMSGGTLTNTGFMAIYGGAGLNGATLNNTGTINCNGTLGIYGGATIQNTIQNTATGIFDFQTDSSISWNGVGSVPSVVNAGLIKKTGGTGGARIDGAVSMPGSIWESDSGSLLLSPYGQTYNGGTFNANSPGSIDMTYQGTNIVAAVLKGTFAGSGTGIVYLDRDCTIDSTGATFNFPSTSPFHWYNSTFSGGTVTNAGSMTSYGGANLNGATLNNTGTINCNGTLGITSGTTIQNTATGVFDFQTDFGISWNNNGSVPSVINAGLIKKTGGTGPSLVDGAVSLPGSIWEAQTGTLGLRSYGQTHTGGLFKATAGAIVNLTEGVSSVWKGGSFISSGAGTIGIYDSTTIDAAGASFNFPASTPLHWGGGYISGGTMTNLGFMAIDYNVYVDGNILDDEGTITNTTVGNNLQLNNGGQLQIGASGAYLFQGNGGILHTVGAASTVTNSGLIRKTAGTGTSLISANFVSNGGFIDIQTGTIQLPTTYVPNMGGLLGKGTLNNAVNNVDGFVRPGPISGVLTVNGNYSQGPNALFVPEMKGTTAADFTQMQVNGTATLGGLLQPIVNYNATVGDTFDVLKSNGISGAFSNVSEGGSVTVNGTTFSVTYKGGTGHDVVLTVTTVMPGIMTPPKVSLVAPNGGGAQRSRVTSLLIQFDQAIVQAGTTAAAFQLTRQSDNAAVTLSGFDPSYFNSKFSKFGIAPIPIDFATLTFIGGPVDFGSLADGRYTLTIQANQITSANGQLDGDGNGIGGDNYVQVGAPGTGSNLFRMFGDINGDGTVSASDFIQFRQFFGGSNFAFDFDGDGSVAASDFIQFRLRFGGSI